MPRPGSTIVWLALAGFLWLQPIAHGQALGVGDPRITEDPRKISDPRETNDPREEQVKPGLEEGLQPLRGPDLFDELYLDGNLGALSTAMAETPWELTDYIYDLCTRWIDLTEDREGLLIAPTEEAKDAEVKVREMARLADKAVGDTRFGYYVHVTLALNAEQRAQRVEQEKHLEQGDAMLGAARSKTQTTSALTPLRRSLGIARLLEDFRGQARCHSLIGRVHVLNKNYAEARANGQDAIRIGRRVRDLRSVWNGWATVMQASLGESDFQGGKSALAEQHRLAIDIGDDIVADAILDQLIQLDRALGKNLPGSLIIYGRRIDQPTRRF